MADDCIFCKVVAGELPATKVFEDDRTVAFMDINPGTEGHLLCVPRTHTEDLWSIEPGDWAAVTETARKMALLVRDVLGAEGVNVINSCRPVAWQTVFHLHVHVIPRSANDPLQLPWTPEPGDLEQIQATGAKLAEAAR